MTIEFARQFQVLRGYHEEAGDRGDDGGGAGDDKEIEGDRGNDLDAGDDGKAEQAAAAAKAAEEKVAAELEAKRQADKAAREKDVAIPKARFDEAVGKERAAREAAQKEAAELRDRLEKQASQEDVVKVQKEIEDLEEELDKALADNDAEAKRRIRRAIREKEDVLVETKANAKAAIATASAVEQIKYDSLVEKMEEKYTFLNVDSEEFDAAAAGEVMELKAAYEAMGLGSTAALRKAVSTLGHKLDARVEAARKAAEPPEEDKAEAKAKADAAAKVKSAEAEAEAKRREKAVGKGQEAKGQQPPAPTDKVGAVDKEMKDIKAADLSDDEFEKLPEAEKKRLRGD